MRRLVVLFKMVVLLQKFGHAYIADDITGRTMEEWVKGKEREKGECILHGFFFCGGSIYLLLLRCFGSLLFTLFNRDLMRWAFYDRQVGHLLVHACIKKPIFPPTCSSQLFDTL